MLSDLYRSADAPNKVKDAYTRALNADVLDDNLRETFKYGLRTNYRTAYGMADVRRDLGLKPKTTEPDGNSND